MSQIEDLVGTKPVTIELGHKPYNSKEFFTSCIIFWNSDGGGDIYWLERLTAEELGGPSPEKVDDWSTKWRWRAEIIGATMLVDEDIFEIEDPE